MLEGPREKKRFSVPDQIAKNGRGFLKGSAFQDKEQNVQLIKVSFHCILLGWVCMYLSEGSLSLFVLSFPFSFACIWTTATCIFRVYFVCLFQVLLIYLLSLPIKKQKNKKQKKRKKEKKA